MRRMNSMLLGHQGASARTDCMYLLDRQPRRRIVPRQRQVHDARRHLDVVGRAAASLLGSSSSVEQPLARQARGRRSGPAASGCPGVRSTMPGRRCSLPAHCISACTRKRSAEVEHQRAVLDEQVRVAVLADTRPRGRSPRGRLARRTGDRRRVGAARRGVGGLARAASRSRAPARVARRARLARATRHEAHACRPALSWPIFHSSAATIVAGQTKPPRLGPSGPRMIGMSPVKSIAPIA